MTTETSNVISTPPLTSGHQSTGRCPDNGWLRQIQRQRSITYQQWLRQIGSPNEGHLSQVVDQWVGLGLLLQFIRERTVATIGPIAAYMPPCQRISMRQLVRNIHDQQASPVLRAVLDAQEFDDSLPIPVITTHRISLGETTLSRRLSLADFGGFHQLCLSRPPAAAPDKTRPTGNSRIRRARGIHYTPDEIVEYLTNRVLAQLTPGGNILALRLLDPSCGCGAFLIAAARYLFRFHDSHCTTKLSMQDRLNLIQGALFGIDLDPQAVQWTRRVLLLTAWESSVLDAAGSDSKLQVPDLRQNILCADFLESDIAPVDAILGGPPFVRLQKMMDVSPGKTEAYKRLFRAAQDGQFDLYMLFFEKAVRCLRENGWLGWSVSNTFLRSSSGRTIRRIIGAECAVRELIEFEARKLYPDAVTQIVLTLLQKSRESSPCRHVWIRGQHNPGETLAALSSDQTSDSPLVEITLLPPDACQNVDWSLNSSSNQSTIAKLNHAGHPLRQLPLRISSGIVTGADSIFLVRQLEQIADDKTIIQDRFGQQHMLESSLLRPIVRNRDVHGFNLPSPRTLCIVPNDQTAHPLSEDDLRNRYPMAYRYLAGHRQQLEARPGGKRPWYALRSAASLGLPRAPRILLKRICAGGDFTIDVEAKLMCHSSLLLVTPTAGQFDPFFLLGVFNSRVFWTFVDSTMPTMGPDRVLRVNKLFQFPLPNTDSEPDSSKLQEIAHWTRQLLTAKLDDIQQREAKQAIDERIAEMYRIPLSALSRPRR